MSDGTKFGIATAKATERITFSDAETGEIKACVYPNELRVGLADSRFRSPAHFRGPIIASRSIIFSDFTPTDTDNRLYNIGGTLYFNGSALGSGGGGGEWTDAGTLLYSTDEEGVVLGGTNAATADILLHSDGGAIFNAQNNSQNFRVNSVNRSYALYVDGANDQVTILSGGAPASLNESAATDMAFFVSGTVGSKDTAVKGTSVFGGDVVISGTLYGGSPLQIAGGLEASFGSSILKMGADGMEVTHGTNILRMSSAGMEVSGNMEIKPPEGQPALVTNPKGPVKIFAKDALKLGTGTGRIDLIDLDDGQAADILIYGGGDIPDRYFALHTPGTLHFTGSTGGSRFKGNVTTDGEFRGSLQALKDGSDYLVAGNNVAVTKNQNGSMTIASSTRDKLVVEVTGHVEAGSPFTIANANFGKARYHPALIDVYANGQLLCSGSSNDYILTADQTNQVTFGFGLIPGDIIISTIWELLS